MLQKLQQHPSNHPGYNQKYTNVKRFIRLIGAVQSALNYSSANAETGGYPETSGAFAFFRLGLIGALMLGFGCTTASWVVEENPVTDPESEELLSETFFLDPVVTPTPQNPILTLRPANQREISYDERLVSTRYIQQYKPRYGYLALGVSGMGLGLYLANTSVIDADKLSGRERALLNVSAVAIGAASFLTMRPVGDPRPAGEDRFLQKAGNVTVTDTVGVGSSGDDQARLTITRGDVEIVRDKPISLSDDRLVINIPQESGIQTLDRQDTTGLDFTVTYNDYRYDNHIPVTDFMQEYLEVTENNVPLRTDPANFSGNIIRHVGSSSQYPLLREVDNHWYRILKSSGSAYVMQEHARIIWRAIDPSDMENLVVQSEQPVFGDLSVERDLPDNRRVNPDGIAIVIVNGAYSDPVRPLPYASRTGELAEHYLTRVLGFYSDNIRVFENMTESEMNSLFEASDSLMIGGRQLSMDESDLFIYYYGHAFTDHDDRLYLLPVDYDPGDASERLVPFDGVSDKIGIIRSRQTILVMDTDWSRNSVFGHRAENNVRSGSGHMSDVSDRLTEQSDNIALFWAAEPGQQAESYKDNNGRSQYPYDIFTWFFFNALKEGATTTSEIDAHLERNVPFTSRRLYDRAQNSGFYGNPNLLFVRE